MVVQAPHQSARTTLLREHLSWPVPMERLYGALNLPPGFRKEITFGSLRIGVPGGSVDDRLLELADRLVAAIPGIRFEVYAGWIVVSAFPLPAPHNVVVSRLNDLLLDTCRERGWERLWSTGVINPHTRAYCGPDLVVAPKGAPEYDGALCGHGVLLVAEVTSPGTVRNDRGAKLTFYGAAGAPKYLLVDLELNEVVLHTRPYAKGYRDRVNVAIGKELTLPEPFGITIETDRLVS